MTSFFQYPYRLIRCFVAYALIHFSLIYCSKIDYHLPLYKPVDVYVAGAKKNGTDTTYTATYWKNGVATSLGNGVSQSSLFSILVSGNDVYAGGYEGGILKYWKNKEGFSVGDTIVGQSMAVVNGQLFFAGYTKNSTGLTTAAYWQGGLLHSLEGNTFTPLGQATSIVGSGSDYYVGGFQSGVDLTTSYIWKNGNNVYLQFSGEINAMTTFNSDVFAAGNRFEQGTGLMASYWKNGILVDLTNGLETASANAITVSGGDVYVAGYETNSNGIKVAKYWKNGVAISLSDGSISQEARAIAVSGNDVYVTTDGKVPNSSMLWKNGEIVFPFDGTSNEFYAYALVVK